jgi:alpha-galactosidase
VETYPAETNDLTSGTRSFFVSINGGASFNLAWDGSTFQTPTSVVIPLQSQAGTNTIEFASSGYGPDLGRIAIALP